MAEIDKTVEKHYCYDHPSAYHDDSALIGAIMSANKSQCDPASMMALANSQNSWNNNPFMYLIWLAYLGGGGLFGNRADAAQNADLSRQLQTLQGTVTDNNNNQIALDAINGNTSAVRDLAGVMNADFNSVQTAICGVKSAIEQVGGQVGYSAESVKNAIAMGDANIVSKMQECCCSNKLLVQQMGYEAQLRDQANTASITSRIDQLANGVQNGFAQIGYQNEKNTAAIIQNNTAQTQRILDQMCANQTQSLRDVIADKDRQLQTQTLLNQLGGNSCGC